jgi:hypothetical protein
MFTPWLFKKCSMWDYKNKKIKSINDIPEGAVGFVYLITDENGKLYIGKKSLFSKRKRRFGKKEIANLPDKRMKKWEYVEKETDWFTYTGSCKPLNEEISKGLKITKEILHFAYNKKELGYYELKEQICQGVIENNDNFWNENILGRYFSTDLTKK